MKRKRTLDGLDALHRAVRNGGKGEILNLLQKQNCNMKDTDKNSNTVLHLIFENEKLIHKEILEFVDIFLNCGVDPNITNDRQETALHLAVGRRLRDVVDILIRYNAKINIRDSEGNYITHFFINDEHEKFRHILELKNDDLHFWYNDTTEKESDNFVEWLMERRFDFDAKNEWKKSALDLAIDRNLLHILPALLKNTNDDNYLRCDYKKLFFPLIEKKFLIQPYYERHVLRIVKILLDRRTSFTIVDVEDARLVKMLIDQFPNSCDGNDYAKSLFHAIMRSCGSWNCSTIDCHLKILGDLVARNVDVNSPNEYGWRPVFSAIEKKNIQALEFLGQNGVDFHVRRSNGQNLLGLLISSDFGCDKSRAIFDFLIAKGCDVNVKDRHGSSLLHLACTLGNQKLVEKLIEHGAEVNCKDKTKRTPLHYAVSVPKAIESDLASLLMESGANVGIQDAAGETPFFLAISRGIRLPLSWGIEANTLLHINDRADLELVVVNMSTDGLEELLAHGLELNDSLLSRFLFELSRDGKLLLLTQHWISLRTAKLPCWKGHIRYVRLQDHQDFYQGCLIEIAKLKGTFIDSHASLYRLLHMDPNDRCIHIDNEKLKELVYTPKLKKQFPKYAVVVSSSYNEAVVRKSLLRPAIEAWLQLTGIYLPEICIKRIIAHLSNVDLMNISGRD